MTSRWITSLISTVALFGVTVSSALPASAEQAQGKGPGVTRVSIVQGQVVVQRGDSNKQVAAVVNAPLLPGDYISTGERSRGELQFDGSTALRLGGNVQARITNDDPNNRQLQLADGTVEIGLVRGAGPVQIDTPSVTVRAHEAGDYRVSIGKDGSSWVTARRGSVEVVSPQRTYTLDSGRTLVARGSASEPSITYTTEVGYDSFDDFNAKRDETMVAALNASPNLNPDIAGYDNLGAYGQWQDVPGYGQSWIPNQSSNWSPYGNGSWTWEDGYGWTWVANEPWGWAPYHYGNWYYANNYGWAWAPPAYSAYPSWSPALVGFFGFGVGFGGPGWGVSLGFGSGGYPYGGYGGYGGGYAGYGYGGFGYPYLGWYPIPPLVAFYPWWPGWAWNGYGWGWGGWGGSGWGNVANVTNITVINRYFPHGGIHGVRVGNFQHGTIHGNTVTVTPRMVGNRIGVIHGAVPVSPTRDNLGFGGHTISSPVSMSRTFESPRFAAAGRSFAGHMAFDEQQRAVSRAIQSNGRNVAPVSASNDRVTSDRSGTLQRSALDRGNLNTGRETAGSGSWQRFGQERGGDLRGNDNRGAVTPGYASDAPRAQRPNSDSWGRFSQARGNVPVTYGDRENASKNVMYGNPNRNDSQNGYRNDSQQRNPYESNTRNSYPSYSRESSYPSYSRGEAAPSYSRNSYPSYARGSYSSYPSYSRGSYSSPPSYSRGSQPSYPRGGSYSAPHPSGGSYSAPRQSGGGGNGGSDRSNHDRGHPPSN